MRTSSRFGRLELPLVLSTLLLAAAPLAAQEAGRIVGRVVDAEQGSPIAGAQLEVVGAAITAIAAVDGRYALQPLAAGPVSIRVRMIGFTPKVVTGVVVAAGGTIAQDIALTASALQLAEISVSAEAERGSVNRALDQQRNATNIVNSVSAEQIARSPDGDAGQAVQRVSGVTVQEGKYVFVRGLGERYTTTSLNGVRIPSPDPERKVVPFDLFPSALLEGITTSKTFTPDQPGDFSGAQVNIKTREFPTQRTIGFSVNAGLNTAATGKDVVRAPTVGSEWLGFAGSERRLPAAVLAAGDFRGTDQSQLGQLIGSFRNAWSSHIGAGAPNGGFGLTVGGEDPVFGQRLGYVGSFTYSYGQEVHKDETRGLAIRGAEPGTTVPFNMYHGSTAQSSVLWGGLLNLSTRLGAESKISLDNSYTRAADNEASNLSGQNEEFSQFNPLFLTRLTFTERAVRSSQLHGEHLIGADNLFDWSINSAGVIRNEPDRSDIGYTARADQTGQLVPFQWTGAPRFATRTFSTLDEHSWDFGANYRLALGRPGAGIAIKFGGLYRTVQRDAASRAYDLINAGLSDTQREVAPEEIFTPANAAAGNLFLTANTNAGVYAASERIGAGYIQAEVPLFPGLRLVGGARVESWRLDVNSISVNGDPLPSAAPRKTDVLPALALNLSLTDDQNLRLSASQTLSRPQYRELSPVPYFEQVGLLTTFGNPSLQRTLIQNYDVRWEWFPRSGEVLSLGVFAKRFTNPIEKVIISQAGANALSFVNAARAHDYGLEAEVRKRLDLVTPALAAFTVFANATLISSRVNPGSAGGVLTNPDRPLIGQSPYVVNTGLSYSNDAGRWTATVLYNLAGRRIEEVGTNTVPDAYLEPRHLLDASLQAPLFGSMTIKLDGRNLLDAPYRLTQGSVLRQRYRLGRIFGLALSWQL